ncbi:hypothetical protein JOD29_000518 [Lysinibacillus composti]|uniref:DUF3953 domain-containing protein n=1 Tax=Lysinibacillus composti TaxID=720633 RepID=A0A3N9UJP7_9BACI|nr:hypothetical protein [Lysinibacillus composti]MBM7607281.1 hypothetical protein [Lysinibacillus composti]RQW76145.1 hypothetical protein EBB45_00920 [Lysinibacillus composti]
MNETKRAKVLENRNGLILLIQKVIIIIALILFMYLAFSDNMVVAPFFYMSLSLGFFISGYLLYKKNSIVAQKIAFYIAGIVLVIIAFQDLMQ